MTTLPFSKQAAIDVLIFVLVLIPLLLLHYVGKPEMAGFWCHDKDLSYPYKQDTVSMPLLMLFSIGGPFFMMSIVETFRASCKTRTLRQFRSEIVSLIKAYFFFIFGMAVNCVFTEFLKFYVGRLRPHFFDTCRPEFDNINCTIDLGRERFVELYECTNTLVDQRLLVDVHMSFPSGHASMALYGALYTAFHLQMRMEVSFSHLLRPVLQAAMILLALFCCITRVSDNRHFATDVLAGTIIGSSLAWLVFYKIAYSLIPGKPSEKCPRLARATSIESEPQTPTPLLRPDRLVIAHSYRNHLAREGNEDFVHKI